MKRFAKGTPIRVRIIERSVRNQDTGCWNWIGHIDAWGYGRIRWNGRCALAHRESYCEFVGAVPSNQVVRHRCDNPSCVNPEHLEPGTHADNTRDCIERGRHPLFKVTESIKSDILRLRDRGESFSKIGISVGLSKSQAHKVWRKHAELRGAR